VCVIVCECVCCECVCVVPKCVCVCVCVLCECVLKRVWCVAYINLFNLLITVVQVNFSRYLTTERRVKKLRTTQYYVLITNLLNLHNHAIIIV